ncbi:DUF1365 family protein [Streptomyces fagopyri]|uniref:DUF1365 family protein n=1 Tax=Streptomyces fagopyri TaxID=2662397 RepID=A0A5Q0LM74_9ACTN|nr:DUF1365 domain-containing protein [Streptomyces fagopyri]QFZ78198.1 DUF1365 family protein [Streptomyces fagopyri]
MVTGTPALYPCTVSHVRTAPTRYALRHRTYMWLTDPDHPPRLPLPLRPLARFDPRDHFDGDQPTIRAGLDHFLAGHGVDLRGGSVTMLAHARVLGHVFNPLTLYWCHDPGGAPRCVVAEVHNTYGERHCYLLLPDDAGTTREQRDDHATVAAHDPSRPARSSEGERPSKPLRSSEPAGPPEALRPSGSTGPPEPLRPSDSAGPTGPTRPTGPVSDPPQASERQGPLPGRDPHRAGKRLYRTEKQFYVSPFFPVDGEYRMRLPLPDDRLDLMVRLERAGTRPFSATVRGTRREATAGTLLRAALRHPFSTLAVSAAIRVHGIRLYLRGLPVQPRPRDRNQESDT